MERQLAYKILRDTVALRNNDLNQAVRSATEVVWGRPWWKWMRDIEIGLWPINEDCGYTMRNLFDIVLEGVAVLTDPTEREPLYPIIDYFCMRGAVSNYLFTPHEFSIILERVGAHDKGLGECLSSMMVIIPAMPGSKHSVWMSFSRYAFDKSGTTLDSSSASSSA